MLSPWLTHMQELLETLNQGVLLITPGGVITFANQVFADLIGMPVGEIICHSARDFYGGADLKYLEERRSRIATADQYEFFLPRQDGRRVPVIINAKRLKSPDGVEFAIVTFTDISELKAQACALHTANMQLEDNQRQFLTELALAARVQQSMAPRAIVWGNISVETHYEPVHTIGGDFGLVSLHDNHLHLLVCDVSGHGIGSALIANRIYTETVALLEHQENLGRMMRQLNRLVLDHIQLDGFFFTMAAARIDSDRHLTFASAGHPPGILVSPGGECRLLEARNALLGLVDDAVELNATQELDLAPGDRLLLCTDGLTEVFDADREMLGHEGLARIVQRHAAAPLAKMKQAILDEVAAWRHGPVTDDISLVLVEVG